MKRRTFLAGLAALGACGPAAPTARAGVLSLFPAATETAAALGALDRLSGRSDWCNYPPEVASLPAFGSALTPDLERIAALGPRAILVDGSVGGQGETLRALAPVEVLPWLSVEDVIASTKRLGVVLDAPADALAARYAPLTAAPPLDGPEVLAVLANDSVGNEIFYIRPGSIHGGALHAAGARNAVRADPGGAPALSVEALIALDPPTVLVLTTAPVTDALRAEIVAGWAKYAPLRAVRDGRIGVVGGPAALNVGPSVLELVGALRAELARLG